jgi:hypothetical protein
MNLTCKHLTGVPVWMKLLNPFILILAGLHNLILICLPFDVESNLPFAWKRVMLNASLKYIDKHKKSGKD